jgi:hypothetical protein
MKFIKNQYEGVRDQGSEISICPRSETGVSERVESKNCSES